MKSKTDGATAFYALNYANGGHDKLFMGYTMADSSVYSKTVKCINPFTQGSIISALNISTAITTVKALPANCAYGILDTEFTRSTFDNTQAAGT